jgi:hypothetical protein
MRALRAPAASLLTLTAILLAPLAVAATGCGGSEPAAVAPPPSATASQTAPPVASTPPAPSATVTETASAPPPPPPPPVPTSTVATTKTDPGWTACHQSFKATAKDVSKDVAAMGKACEATTKMKPSGKAMTGKQADENPPQAFPFEAKANKCYRAYAQATEGIKDLDVVIKDSAGVVVGQDSTDDPSPVVLEDGAVCFSKDDKASVVVSVGMGKGSYAVQVWSN